MGTTMCVPRRRRDESPLSYFGIPVSTLTVYEQRLVQQSTSYIPGVPILLQDIAFYWDSQVGGAAASGTTAAVSPDSLWIASVEKTINDFAKKCKLFSLRRNVRVGKGSSDTKKKSSGKCASRVFDKPFNAFLGKTPLRAPHFVALLTLFLRKLPEPLLTSLYVRQTENILGNKQLSEEEKAQALQKSSRQTFMSTHPTEHAVYQYLKQLVQRHRAELIAAEVELLVRSMVREPNEHVMEFILQQLRPVVGPVLTTPKREVLTDNKPELSLPHEDTSRVLGDDAGDAEEVLYSPPESHSEAAREEGASMSSKSTNSFQPTSARRSCSEEMEATGGKKKNTSDNERPAEEGTRMESAMRYAYPTDSSQSCVTDEERSVGEGERGELPVAPRAAMSGPIEEVGASGGVGEVGVPKKSREVTCSGEEGQVEGCSVGSRKVETTPHHRALVADSVQAMNTSGELSRSAKSEPFSTPKETKKNASMDVESVNVAAGNIDIEKNGSVDLVLYPPGVPKLDVQIAERRESPPLCACGDTNNSAQRPSRGAASLGDDGDNDKQQEKPQQSPSHGVMSLSLEKQSSQSQLVGSSPAAKPCGHVGASSPVQLSGKGPLSSDSGFFIEKHPRYAALLGAKQLFLGNEVLPPRRIQLDQRPSAFIAESVDMEREKDDSEPLPTGQVSAHTAEFLNGADRPLHVHDACTGPSSNEATDKPTCAHDERVLREVIHPLVVQIEYLTARSESLEQLLRANGVVPSPCQAPQLVKQVDGEVTVLKDVVRQLVDTHAGVMEDVISLQRQLEEQRKRLECDAAGKQSWQSDAVTAKETALEAQRRCAILEKAHIQSHQSCQYMSLRLKDLASKIERGENDSLNLKIEISTLQRQAVLLREGLLSIR